MYGQWIGRFTGTNNGFVVLNIDDNENNYSGSVHVYEDNSRSPDFVGIFMTFDKTSTVARIGQVIIVDKQTSQELSATALLSRFPGVTIPKSADLSLVLESNKLTIEWHTDIGTHGTAIANRSKADNPSTTMPEECNDWETFRSIALANKPGRFIFRGQSNAHRLRTAFHRTKRKDLLKFLRDDIPALHRALAPRTKHLFNLSDGNDNGAFWNLLQHHGYPTPLLDWSFSPFVAAYFAFQAGPERRTPDASVRIFMFDAESWRAEYPQVLNVGLAKFHFSILDVYPFENERFTPQQALSVLTNIDDIESFLQSRDENAGKRFLKVFDIPYRQRDQVLDELEMMGITYGSLFPGIDGLCLDMRARFFGRDT